VLVSCSKRKFPVMTDQSVTSLLFRMPFQHDSCHQVLLMLYRSSHCPNPYAYPRSSNVHLSYLISRLGVTSRLNIALPRFILIPPSSSQSPIRGPSEITAWKGMLGDGGYLTPHEPPTLVRLKFAQGVANVSVT